MESIDDFLKLILQTSQYNIDREFVNRQFSEPNENAEALARDYAKEIEDSMMKIINADKESIHLDNSELTIAKVRSLLIILFKFLDFAQSPELNLQLLQAICNYGKIHHHTLDAIVTAHIVERIVELLNDPDQRLYEQVLTTIGMVIEGSPKTLPLFVKLGTRSRIFQLLKMNIEGKNFKMMCYWTLTLLVNVKSIEDEDSQYYIELIVNTLKNEKDKEVLALTCKMVNILCQNHDYLIIFFQNNIIQQIVQFLSEYDSILVRPCLRIIGNIICLEVDKEHNIDFTQEVLRYDIIPILKTLMSSSQKDIEKEACWTLSNIAAGTTQQIQLLLDNGILDATISLLRKSHLEPELLTEVAYVLFNITTVGSEEQIASIMTPDLLNLIISLMVYPKFLEPLIDSIDNILQIGNKLGCANHTVNEFAEMINKENLQLLQNCKYVKGKKKGEKLWNYYFMECKICNNVFSKCNSKLSYCNQCRCYVCPNCNCSVFHINNVLLQFGSLSPSTKSKKKKNKKKKKKNSTDTKATVSPSTPTAQDVPPATSQASSKDTSAPDTKKEEPKTTPAESESKLLLSQLCHPPSVIDPAVNILLNSFWRSQYSQTKDPNESIQSRASILDSLTNYIKNIDSVLSDPNVPDTPSSFVSAPMSEPWCPNGDEMHFPDDFLFPLDFTLEEEEALRMYLNGDEDYDINSLLLEDLLRSLEVDNPTTQTPPAQADAPAPASPNNDEKSTLSQCRMLLTDKLRCLTCTEQDVKLCDSLIDYLETTSSVVRLAEKIEELNPA